VIKPFIFNFVYISAWSKALVCGRSIGVIAVSNPTEDMNVRLMFVVCCVGSGRCDELVTLSEESYGVCLCVCDLDISNKAA
jgi:hypothetical protein